MTAKTAGELALKVWSVILVVSALLSIPGIVAQFGTARSAPTDPLSWRIAAIANSVHFALTLGLALLLFKYAHRISSALEPEEGHNGGAIDSASLQAVAFGTLGAYFLVLGIRQCAGIAFEFATRPAYEQEALPYLWRNPRVLVEALVQTISGLILLLGRHGLSAAWARLRARDNKRSAQPEE